MSNSSLTEIAGAAGCRPPMRGVWGGCSAWQRHTRAQHALLPSQVGPPSHGLAFPARHRHQAQQYQANPLITRPPHESGARGFCGHLHQ